MLKGTFIVLSRRVKAFKYSGKGSGTKKNLQQAIKAYVAFASVIGS